MYKVLKGTEVRQKIEKVALALMTPARKLCRDLMARPTVVWINQPIKHMLYIPDFS
jgi:hypothetical protein